MAAVSEVAMPVEKPPIQLFATLVRILRLLVSLQIPFVIDTAYSALLGRGESTEVASVKKI